MAVPGQLRMAPIAGAWTVAKDGDPACLRLFRNHYSYRPYADGRNPKLFCGPGQKLVLVTAALDALFVWRRFRDDSGQVGVNCAVFRNESPRLASDLIREAERLAWERWPDESRLYTYVNQRKVRHKRDPGRCFIRAGWTLVGKTKWNKLLIFEKRRPLGSTELSAREDA